VDCGRQSHKKALESVFDKTEQYRSMLKDLFLTKITATLMPRKDCGNPQNPSYMKAITRVVCLNKTCQMIKKINFLFKISK